MDEKDLLIAKLRSDAIVARTQNAVNMNVTAAMIKAKTLKSKADTLAVVNAQNAARMARQQAREQDFDQRIKENALRNQETRNRQLESEIAALKREMAEMRETMREWVASQRGLMALAKALKEEVESCPNKEHHKLADKDARSSIADAAADASYDSNDAEIAIKNEIPAFSKRHPRRKGKTQ